MNGRCITGPSETERVTLAPGKLKRAHSLSAADVAVTANFSPPTARKRRNPDLSAGAMVGLTEHDVMSSEIVRRRLAEANLKPWRGDWCCITHVDGIAVARLEPVLNCGRASNAATHPFR